MTCDTTEFDGLPIEFYHLTIDGKLTETELMMEGLEFLALLLQSSSQSI